MTKELWEKHSENWGNGCPLMPEENFYKALFDYREWLLSQVPIAGQVEPVVKVNFAEFEKTAEPFYKEIRSIVHYPNTNASPEVKNRLCALVTKIFDENWKWFNSKISA